MILLVTAVTVMHIASANRVNTFINSYLAIVQYNIQQKDGNTSWYKLVESSSRDYDSCPEGANSWEDGDFMFDKQ